MPKRTDISQVLILGSGPIVRRVLKGRAFKARRNGNERLAALAREVPR